MADETEGKPENEQTGTPPAEAEGGKPAAEGQAGEPGTKPEGSGGSASKEPSADKASPEKASAEKASAEKASAEKASAEKASAEKASAKDEKSSEKAASGSEEKEEEKDKSGQPQTAEEVFLALEGGEDKPKILKAKGSKNVRSGIVHILATYNNTKVTVTDLNGNMIGWSSSGKLGFRGSRKSTAYASQLVSQDACRQAMGHGLKSVEVRVKGPGAGRESAIRAIQNLGIDVTVIRDVTPVPHNGCRPRKPRRV